MSLFGPPGAPCKCCGVVSTSLKVCSRCKNALYCSPECQTADWRAKHKKECTPLAASPRLPLSGQRGGIPLRAEVPRGMSEEVENRLDAFRLRGLALGFPRVTEVELRDCALALFEAAGVKPSYEVARPGVLVLRRLRGVTTVAGLPNKCYAVSNNACEKLGAASYLEGFLFPEGTLAPMSHALFRTRDGQLQDITRSAHPDDVYICAEFKASVYCANVSDPEVRRLLESECSDGREGYSLPYLRSCLARGKDLGAV